MLERGKNECLRPKAVPRVTGSKLAVLRCGQCVNCLRHKGAQLAVRLFRETNANPLVYFLTFTYRNNALPVRSFVRTICEETGEVMFESAPRWIDEPKESLRFYRECPGEMKTNKDGKRSKLCRPLVEDISTPFSQYMTLKTTYWSLRVKDMQDALKRFRTKCDTKFKYFICPEYGGLTFRPHYHMAVVGLNNADKDKLVAEWPYGNVYVQKVDTSAPDKSVQIAKMSAYVSKYCCKGMFDCPYIASGEAIRPHRSSSVRFGFGNASQYDSLKRWLLGFDVFGEYDYKTIEPSDEMVELLSNRRYVFINDKKYPIPPSFINEFFRVRVESYDSCTFDQTDYVQKYMDKICLYPFRFNDPIGLLDYRNTFSVHCCDHLRLLSSKFYRNIKSGVVPYRYYDPQINVKTFIYVKSKKFRYLSTPLQRKIALALLRRSLQDAEEQRQNLFEASEMFRDSSIEYWNSIEDAERLREKSAENAFRTQLLDSVF